MAWFSKKQPVAVVEPELAPKSKKVVTGPRLAVLTPDIAGISSFRLTLEDDAADAELLVAGLRADVRRGTHAFWAMHQKPDVDESMHVETLVLIRAKSESDLVYVVSFLDLESALSFTRFEVRRGLYIGNVMVYWAAFAQVREELEGVTILPSSAPPAVAATPFVPEAHLAPPLPQARVQIAEPIAEPEPELESIAEAEARKAVERYLEQNPEKSAELVAEEPVVIEDSVAVIEPPVIEQAPAPIIESLPIFDDAPVTEEAAVADALVLQHPPVAEPVVEIVRAPAPQPEPEATEPSPYVYQRKPASWAPKRKWSAREARERAAAEALQHPEAVAETDAGVAEPFQARNDTATVEQPPALETSFAEAPTIELVAEAPDAIVAPAPESTLETQESEALQVIAQRISTYAGDEEAEAEQAIEIEARGPAIDPANGLPHAEKYNEFDIALEVERLLKNRKWESREGPFRGFKSPPGRF